MAGHSVFCRCPWRRGDQGLELSQGLGGRRIRYPTLTTALGRGGGTGSRERVVRDGELGPHGGRMRGRPRILQRAATSQGGAWSGRHLGRHGLEDVRAARVLHRHTMAQGAHAAASRHAERSPRSLKMGRASVTGCPSAASRSSQVSVSHVADGHGRRGCQSALTAGRGATAELRQ